MKPLSANPVEGNRPQPPADLGQNYCAFQGCMWGFKDFKNTRLPFKISNFSCRIASDQVIDDGTEQFRIFTIEADISGKMITADIPAKDFKAMNWIAEKLGGKAIVYPGQTEHARAAIQSLSGDIAMRHIYSHTGWRTIDGSQYYLHTGGAIGEGGNRTDVCVSLEDKLPNYILPAPAQSDELITAVRASLQVLEVAPDRLTFPVYASIWRAILGQATFSLHISGSSGAGKSQLAALAQQHFGPAMDADNLPASWLGTANATGTLAFYAKDALLVVDDFVPAGNAASQQKLHNEADRLLRAQGNSAGRRRLSSDGRLLGNRPPRGLILSTGEDTPRGKSLNARMILLHFPKVAMNWPRLTTLQEWAAKGEFAKATYAFVHWLAPILNEVREAMGEQRLTQRRESDCRAVHMRTPENLNSLHFGFVTFLRFAESIGALSQQEARALADRCEKAFQAAAAGESQKHVVNEPSRIFLRLLNAAVTMGRAHLASPEGAAPEGDFPWGWQAQPGSERKQSKGERVGWVKGYNLFLLPEAAHSVVSKMAQEQGETIPGSLETIKRDLKEQGFLAKTDEKRGVFTVRRTFQGKQENVLFLTNESCQKAIMDSPDNPDNPDNPEVGEEE